MGLIENDREGADENRRLEKFDKSLLTALFFAEVHA